MCTHPLGLIHWVCTMHKAIYLEVSSYLAKRSCGKKGQVQEVELNDHATLAGAGGPEPATCFKVTLAHLYMSSRTDDNMYWRHGG